MCVCVRVCENNCVTSRAVFRGSILEFVNCARGVRSRDDKCAPFGKTTAIRTNEWWVYVGMCACVQLCVFGVRLCMFGVRLCLVCV